MKASEGHIGRVFVIRLEHGEIVHQEIEKFASEKSIEAAALIAIGGSARGSRFVVGPADETARPINPMEHILEGVHEITGAGTLFPDEHGQPMLHMHLACGRETGTVTGCIRNGVKVWQVMEVILMELAGSLGRRFLDPALGFNLLRP